MFSICVIAVSIAVCQAIKDFLHTCHQGETLLTERSGNLGAEEREHLLLKSALSSWLFEHLSLCIFCFCQIEIDFSISFHSWATKPIDLVRRLVLLCSCRGIRISAFLKCFSVDNIWRFRGYCFCNFGIVPPGFFFFFVLFFNWKFENVEPPLKNIVGALEFSSHTSYICLSYEHKYSHKWVLCQTVNFKSCNLSKKLARNPLKTDAALQKLLLMCPNPLLAVTQQGLSCRRRSCDVSLDRKLQETMEKSSRLVHTSCPALVLLKGSWCCADKTEKWYTKSSFFPFCHSQVLEIY